MAGQCLVTVGKTLGTFIISVFWVTQFKSVDFFSSLLLSGHFLMTQGGKLHSSFRSPWTEHFPNNRGILCRVAPEVSHDRVLNCQ